MPHGEPLAPERGKYIVFEGGDGTGKSTQVGVMQQRLGLLGIRSIQIHEPDGFEGDATLGIPAVPEATELRKKIKDATIPRTPWQNVEWFTESRKLNWRQAMNPALKMGIWVFAARSWYSTVTYQGCGEGVPFEDIERITLEEVGEDYLNPDLAIILALQDEKTRMARIDGRGALERPDTFESKPASFQAAMQDGYTWFGEQKGIKIIDASPSQDEVSELLWDEVKQLLPEQLQNQSFVRRT